MLRPQLQTILKLTTGPSEYRIGRLIDIRESEWGPKFDVVMANGEIREASTIHEEGRLGIGWAIASQADIDRHNRLARQYKNFLESA